MLGGDIVAMWDVALSDGVYRIEFAHGTTTGKRIVYINGQEVVRKDWMFKLVGKETFTVGGMETKATIIIEAITGFSYEYSLEIDGKSLETFIYNRAKATKTWLLKLDGEDYRIVLEACNILKIKYLTNKKNGTPTEKDTMDVWCNGQKMVTMGEFVEDGTETHFMMGEHECCIRAMSNGKKKGLMHYLLVDGAAISTPQ